MTRREAAEYLRWQVDEVDRNLVLLDGHPAAVTGKMRYLAMDAEGALRVRILAADVFSILPLPPIQDSLAYPTAGARDHAAARPSQSRVALASAAQ